MSFVFPALLAGLALVALPVLIHLINMMRHRRVQWAAMEFLLVSQKKNRTWILLKQLLLLLLRMGAVAAVVLMVAQPQVRNRLGIFFGGNKTHHIVLVDDSYSMSERWADTSAFDEAKKRVLAIARQAEQQNLTQEFTLLRFSKASRAGRGMQPDLRQTMDSAFRGALEQKLEELKPSELSVGPAEALDTALQLIEDGSDQHSEVYLISDFRANEWNEVDDLRKRLSELNDLRVEPKLIACVDQHRSNLTITSLKPLPGTRAAGVNLEMEVTVHNHGSDKARAIAIQLEEDGKPRPAETIDELAPGKSQSRKFEVKFTQPGEHRITARLQSDAVAADDARYTVVNFEPNVPVLLIEGDAKSIGMKASDSYFVANAIAPELALTGLKAQIEPPDFLSKKPLDAFDAIYVLNMERLTSSEGRALEDYCRAGGGVAFFLGDRTSPKSFNETAYRDGAGLIPVPLIQAVELGQDRSEAPDIEVTVHPIFGNIALDKNRYTSDVNIDKYMAVEKTWRPAAGSTANIVARLRNGAPLIIEQKYGEGRVVVFLTTAGREWNNWAATPSYILTMLQLQAYLSTWKQIDPARTVGAPIKLEFPSNYLPEVALNTPLEGSQSVFSMQATPAGDKYSVVLDNTEKSGIYELRLTTADGQTESMQYPYNVTATEGNLAIVNQEQMADRLGEVVYEFHRAGDLAVGSPELGQNLSQTILYALVFMLLAEQLLAYSASYHLGRAKEGAK
jgi:hypothetical protein